MLLPWVESSQWNHRDVSAGANARDVSEEAETSPTRAETSPTSAETSRVMAKTSWVDGGDVSEDLVETSLPDAHVTVNPVALEPHKI